MGYIAHLQLNDALYNAGLLGFIKICRHCNLEVKQDDTSISFSNDILEHFTRHYLDTLFIPTEMIPFIMSFASGSSF